MKTIRHNNLLINPGKIICVGRNYVDHIAELGNEVPDDMVVFLKPNSAITTKLLAEQGEALHYEGEICFLVERKRLTGVGFGLDLTKRALQNKLKEKRLPWELAKAFDGSALFSPFVDVPKQLDDLTLELWINDERVQQGGVELMMRKPADILATLRESMTPCDGDIIMTGTPKGVGQVMRGASFEGRILSAGKVITSARWTAE